MRPVATDVTRSMVCVYVCLCVGHTGKLCIRTEPIEMPFGGRGGLTLVGVRNLVLDGVEIFPREGSRGKVQVHCNVPTHKCIIIAHCLPDAASKCACPAHAENECIRHEG